MRFGRVIFAALVVLVLAGIYGVAATHHGTTRLAPGPAGQTAHAQVATAVRMCAAPGSAGVTSGSVAIAAEPGASVTGSAVITRLAPGGSASPGPVVGTAAKPGVLQVAGVRPAPALTKAQLAGHPGSSNRVTTQAGRGGVQVSASRGMAQGLEVEQTGAGGLVTGQCGTPGTNFWFVGPGQATAGTIELYLMNGGDQPADVQVSVLTDVTKGAPILGNADNGITVPPHGMVTQQLGGLLQGSKVVALSVSTSVGQIVAAVRESKTPTGAGTWLAPTGAPATKLVIPGLPGGSGSRQLYLAVPGNATAQVKITAVTGRGSYQPTGGDGIDLLGGSATTIPLPSLGGVPGSIKITTNVPVTAAMLVPGGATGAPGVVIASGERLREQGVLAANPARAAGSTQLVLSAPGRAASVRITTATATEPASGDAGKVVQIAKGSSVVVPVAPAASTKASQFMVIVTPLPGSGPVYAGQLVSAGGSLRSVLPVPSSLTWIPLPPVTDALSQASG
ncbi:MAG TPA: DUF5719 family protein [Streptosporangiaceae bacterium]